MFQFLRGVALIAAMSGFAYAEDANSANYIMPGCRLYLQPSLPANGMDGIDAGRCSGLVSGLFYAAIDVCNPAGVTTEQLVRVVVQYIDNRPARLNESFNLLAVEALRAAWPCKN